MRKLLFSAVLAGSFMIWPVFTCAQEQDKGQQAMPMPMDGREPADSGVIKKAVNAGNVVCPVTDERIDENTKATYEYQGKIYNFCCPMCIDTFKSDPQKYIKKIEGAPQANAD